MNYGHVISFRVLSLYARSELRKRPKVCVPNMLKIKVFLHT
jgi:hypothetical protein